MQGGQRKSCIWEIQFHFKPCWLLKINECVNLVGFSLFHYIMLEQ